MLFNIDQGRQTLPQPALWPSSRSIAYARAEAILLSLCRSLHQTHAYYNVLLALPCTFEANL